MSETRSNYLPILEAFKTISAMAERGGPNVQEYPIFWNACASVGYAKESRTLDDRRHAIFMDSLGIAGTRESLMGHIYRRPYGYAGDFEIIDKLYRNHRSDHAMVNRWDAFVQSVPSSQAVRNRGAYLLRTLQSMFERHVGSAPLRLLSLGSGPCRDIEHALDGLGLHGKGPIVTCIDMDQHAIAKGQLVLSQYKETVTFRHADVLRLKHEEPVDLIWASGLFDYFSNRAFKLVLRRLLAMLAPGGQVVVGNFSEQCGGLGPMSFVNWNLTLRSGADLCKLAEDAGAADIAVDAEPTGLNLFLHVQNEGAKS